MTAESLASAEKTAGVQVADGGQQAVGASDSAVKDSRGAKV